MTARILALCALLPFAGCVTARATAFRTPRERVTECVDLCSGMGLRMSALVVILNASGCICEPEEKKTSTGGASTAVRSGATMAAAVVIREEEQQQHAR